MELHWLGVSLFTEFSDKSRNISSLFTLVCPPPPYLFSFWNRQLADRPSAVATEITIYCTSLEPLPEPVQKKICYRLHPKYTPFSVLQELAPLHFESLNFYETGVTYAIFNILKKAE